MRAGANTLELEGLKARLSCSMRKKLVLGLTLAALAGAPLGAQAPRPKPVPSSPANRATPRPPGGVQATLLIQTDANAAVDVDGESIGVLAADGLKRVPVSFGQHIVRATSRARPSVRVQRIVDVKSPAQTIVVLEVAAAERADMATPPPAASAEPPTPAPPAASTTSVAQPRPARVGFVLPQGLGTISDDAVVQFARRTGLDLVFDFPKSGLVYADDARDISSAVLADEMLVAPPPASIAYVVLQRVVELTDLGKTSVAQVQRRQASEVAAMADLEAARTKRQHQLEQTLANSSAYAEAWRALQQAEVTLQQHQQQAQAAVQRFAQEIDAEFQKVVSPAIERVAKSGGLALVFNGEDASILYADDALDVTLSVVQCMDTPASAENCQPPSLPPPSVAFVDMRALAERSTFGRRLDAAVAAGTVTRESADTKLQRAVGETVRLFAKNLGIRLVLNKVDAGLVATTAALDVTTEIVSRLNRLNP